jgi:hypothetical protein
LKAITLVCGLLAIIISSLNYLIQEKIEKDLSRIEYASKEDNARDEHQIIYLPDYLASISSFQIDVYLTQYILVDIPSLTDTKIWHDYFLEYKSISFFKILFQNIISPNAP